MALAALALLSLLGSTDAGTYDGPCTLTPTSGATGACPANLESCFGEVQLSPSASGATGFTATFPTACPLSSSSVGSLTTDTFAGVYVDVSGGYKFVLSGYGGSTIYMGVMSGDLQTTYCYARSPVSQGTCLWSDRSNGPSPFASASVSQLPQLHPRWQLPQLRQLQPLCCKHIQQEYILISIQYIPHAALCSNNTVTHTFNIVPAKERRRRGRLRSLTMWILAVHIPENNGNCPLYNTTLSRWTQCLCPGCAGHSRAQVV